MGSSVDFVLNYYLDKKDNLYRFFQRKIDLYHTMSSVWVSLFTGLIIGLLFRGFSIASGYLLTLKLDIGLLLFTLGASIFFILILKFLRNKIFFEYHPMLRLILNTKEVNQNLELKENLKTTFNEEYFK